MDLLFIDDWTPKAPQRTTLCRRADPKKYFQRHGNLSNEIHHLKGQKKPAAKVEIKEKEENYRNFKHNVRGQDRDQPFHTRIWGGARKEKRSMAKVFGSR